MDLKEKTDNKGLYTGIFAAGVLFGTAGIKLLSSRDAKKAYTKVTAACIGKQTKAAADAWGMKTYMAEKATIDSVLELVQKIL